MFRTFLMIAGIPLICSGCGSSQSVEVAPPPSNKSGAKMLNTPFFVKGIETPPAVPAKDALVDDDAEIIGVVVKGKARAYVVKQMRPIMNHVVNDRLSDTSVTVTYCDRDDCVRVLTDPEAIKPLPINLGGYSQSMLIQVDGLYYFQDSGKSMIDPNYLVAYQFMPHTRMLWKDWRAQYPETDVVAKLKSPNTKTESPSIALPKEKP